MPHLRFLLKQRKARAKIIEKDIPLDTVKEAVMFYCQSMRLIASGHEIVDVEFGTANSDGQLPTKFYIRKEVLNRT